MKAADQEQCMRALRQRFEKNMRRHAGIDWAVVEKKLQSSPDGLSSLWQMEQSEGEPDVIGHDPKTKQLVFCDCSAESPKGRRSLCYDRAALDSRKENKPKGSAFELAATMGIELLTEEQYRALQLLGEFDAKTSSWIATPAGIRELGGALFCDRRFGHVFTYHNGAESYYAARGFRGRLTL